MYRNQEHVVSAHSDVQELKAPSEQETVDYKALLPEERIRECLLEHNERVLITTSGGIQSGVLIALYASVRNQLLRDGGSPNLANIPVVLIDTGDLFEESVSYARAVTYEREVPLVVIQHALSGEELGYNMELLLRGNPELLPEDAYDEMTKVRPLRAYIRKKEPLVWLAGNRREQSPSRSSLAVYSAEEVPARLYPLADVDAESLSQLKSALDIIRHPLADEYASVGNRSDTLSGTDGEFEKSGRHNGVKQECGLHERRVKMGLSYVKRDGIWKVQEDVPITEQIYESYKA